MKLRQKNKVYRTEDWTWFYKNFIHKTVNDNFFTMAEVIQRKEDIINRVKNVKVSTKNKEGSSS